jgi:hypothetical protein
MGPSAPPPARLPVSAEVARLVAPGTPRELQLTAARGDSPLVGSDLLTALAFLCTSADTEVKGAALATLRSLPGAQLLELLADPDLHPRLIDLLARVRMTDLPLMEQVVVHPAVADATLRLLAERGTRPVLEYLAGQLARLTPDTARALFANPQAGVAAEEPAAPDEESRESQPTDQERDEDDPVEAADEPDGFPSVCDGDPEDFEEVSDEQINAIMEDAEAQGMSKYQLAMELKVSEKIKIAMTGDKEWRAILIKDPNKLVHSAVLRNGRITEGEVIMAAKNKTSSDEIIRLILLNRDWLKHYEIRKALVVHPKTPLPKALRFLSELGLRDLKDLARSRNVSSVIAISARKELERKNQRGG